MRTALRRLANLPLFTVNAIWAIPSVIIIRLARPWVHVRMGTLESSRIGHFVADASVFLACRAVQSRNKRTIDLFWFPKKTCNKQWAKMVRRQLYVRSWVKYLISFNKRIPGGAFHDLRETTSTSNWGHYSIFKQTSARFEFTLEEEEIAKDWLRRRGWQAEEPFVCLLVRDSVYLSSDPLHTNSASDRWGYHSYRDSDIDTYVEAIQALADRGYWVIRMGKIMHKPLHLEHQRVIDYSFAEDRDDLIDIWLSTNCHFFVSTGTGMDTLPWSYGIPVVYVNALPLAHCATSINHIWVPKHLRWKKSGDLLTLKEHCQHCYFRSEEYEQAGITIEDLSPTEITATILECEQRVAGTWAESDEDKKRQRRFWEVLRSWPDFPKYHGNIHPEARVGSAWLKSMGDAFLA